MSGREEFITRLMDPNGSVSSADRPREEAEATTPVGRVVRHVPLFVIKKKGQDQYWACSGEHGSGWCDRHPKQSFTKSELQKQIYLLIDKGWFTDLEILQLYI